MKKKAAAGGRRRRGASIIGICPPAPATKSDLVKRLVLILPLLCLLAACAPKKPVSTEAPVEPGKQLLAQAEDRLAAGQPQEALALYDRYIQLHPDGKLLAEALLNAGRIRRHLGREEAAESDYLRLVRDFPQSPQATDALLGLAEIFYERGKYGEVLQFASEVIQRPISSAQIFRTYALLGDTYLSTGAAKDAVYFFAMAGQHADPIQSEQIRSKMKQAVRQLDSAAIAELLQRLEDPLPVGYLLYQRGLNETEADNFSAATGALEQFLERFPDHEYAEVARALVEEIRNNYTYHRNVLGCLLPLSGPYQPYGRRALKGIELALHRFGGAAGPGQPGWQLLVRDTGSDPDRAVAAVQEFFAEKVAAVIGPIFTAEAAAAEAQALGIPIMVLSQKENLPDIGSFVFRNFMTPQMQAQTLVSHLVRDMGLRRFGVFFPEETYGYTFLNEFWKQTTALGGEVVAAQAYDGEQTDFSGAIRSLVGMDYYKDGVPARPGASESAPWGPECRFLEEVILGVDDMRAHKTGSQREAPKFEELVDPVPVADFDALFIPDSAPKIGMIVPQLAYDDVTDVVLLGTNLWHSDRLLELAGQYMQGALVPDGYFAKSTSGPVIEFAGAYRDAHGEEPGFIEAIAYDTATILFDIVGRSQSEFRSGLRDEILTVQGYPAVTGPTSFDQNGEARKRLYLLEVKGRKFREVRPKNPD
ncbi:MAG: penicillin-binding protein activator [Desulfobacterales bacterium]|nr:penicillin-binding protein activator [Desulfobacterales bacterium]